jgi:hypothetical protein
MLHSRSFQTHLFLYSFPKVVNEMVWKKFPNCHLFTTQVMLFKWGLIRPFIYPAYTDKKQWNYQVLITIWCVITKYNFWNYQFMQKWSWHYPHFCIYIVNIQYNLYMHVFDKNMTKICMWQNMTKISFLSLVLPKLSMFTAKSPSNKRGIV